MLVFDYVQKMLIFEKNCFEQKFPFVLEIVTITSQHVMLVDPLPYERRDKTSDSCDNAGLKIHTRCLSGNPFGC